MKRTIFKHMPKWIQKKMIRSAFDLSKTDQNEIHYKLADTVSELKQAFRLVHDAYVKQGFIEPQASQMRMIPHHQLETTGVIVAKQGEKVVGTLTLVRDGFLGLPMESKFNLSSIRKPGNRIAEVTCLAVEEKFRRSHGGLIFPYLMKYMYEFAVQYFDVDQLVVAVYPKDAIFYEGLLCFSFLDKTPVEYFGAPAVGLFLDLNQAPSIFRKIFGRKALAKNLFHFFVETKLKCFSFPEKLYSEGLYPHATEVARKIANQLPHGEHVTVLRAGMNQSQSSRIASNRDAV